MTNNTERYSGADCTLTDGDSNRVLTLLNISFTSNNDFNVYVQGLILSLSVDYTVSHLAQNTVITFLNAIWDTNYIIVQYGEFLVSSLVGSIDTDLKYVGVSEFADVIGIKSNVPSWDVGNTPTNELLGIGDNSVTVFYLDYPNIIYSTYTIYYGADVTSTTYLTETTHYSMDRDNGKITLTSSGKTLVGTNKLYAKYSYLTNGMKNSYIVEVLTKAEKEVDSAVNSTFNDGSGSLLDNPDYPQEIEIQSAEGYYQDYVITRKKPLIDCSSLLKTTLTSISATIALTDGDGCKFPSSGYIIIESEVISYTGITVDSLTGCTRGELGTTAVAHTADVSIHTTILFLSNTDDGTVASWTVQAWETNMFATDNGVIYKFKDSDYGSVYELGIKKRIKIIYYYGYDTIPQDIKRLTILYAKKMLKSDNISKSVIAGRNEFRPEMVEVDSEEIQRIVGRYIVLPMGNT